MNFASANARLFSRKFERCDMHSPVDCRRNGGEAENCRPLHRGQPLPPGLVVTDVPIRASGLEHLLYHRARQRGGLAIVDEEVVLLEEQLAAAEANLERLQSRLAEAEALAAGREQELAESRRRLVEAQSALGEREAQAAARAGEIETLRASLTEVGERARAATSRYRAAVLAREPDLPADLVDGDSVEAIDEAVERARQTVARVRQHLEQQAQALRVPAGAPARSSGALDPASLSASEKIRLGLERG
jgi:hypothetical protein